MAILTYREAIRAGMIEEMERDEDVFIMGEEVGKYQGSYKVTEGMLEQFGEQRVIDTPISEAGFTGMAIGASMLGLRPICELMFWSFCYVAFDQVFNNAANIRYMSGGLINIPLVIRGPANGGTNVGATHSHTPENFVAHTPGLKVVCPVTPYDAKGLIKSAIRDNDPVYVMENTILYNDKGEVPEEEYLIPLGKADLKKEGDDLSIIAHGRAVKTALAAAEILENDRGLSVEVLDLRSIRPLDTEAVLDTVKKTGRAVIVEENKPFCGVGAQISHLIQENAFDYLDGPIQRVSALDAPAIYSKPLEDIQLPSPDRVVQKALVLV